MRKRIAMAIWLMEHLTRGMARESLAGDLLEQSREGRTAAWVWRQAMSAIAWNWARQALEWTPAAVFAAGWSLLYPAWQAMSSAWLPRANPERWAGLAWPRPELIELGCGVAPAAGFVCFGVLVYCVVRREKLRGLSGWRVVGGWSASMNVLLVATLGLLQYSANRDLLRVTEANFYLGFQVLGISLPLALSVLVGLVMTVRDGPRLARGQRTPRQRSRGRLARPAHGLGRGAWLLAVRERIAVIR